MTQEKNNLWIQDLGDRFRFYNVCLDDRLWTVNLRKKLLDNGRSRMQYQWNKRLISSENKENWQLASGPLYHAVLAALHYNQDHPEKKQRKIIQECRKMHAKDFKDYWMTTSTKIIYTSEGLDKIIHDYGAPEQKEIELAFVGDNKYITEKSGLEQEMKALLGANDMGEIESVYHDLTGKKFFLWRVKKKLNQDDSRALMLGVNGNYFNVNTDCFLSIAVRPARGWSVCQQRAPVFYDSFRGLLSLTGDTGNISLVDAGNLSLK